MLAHVEAALSEGSDAMRRVAINWSVSTDDVDEACSGPDTTLSAGKRPQSWFLSRVRDRFLSATS
ncbi:MAG: hypothetical protein AAGA74_00880 [Pseudomonadota bacterium]